MTGKKKEEHSTVVTHRAVGISRKRGERVEEGDWKARAHVGGMVMLGGGGGRAVIVKFEWHYSKKK